MKRILSQGDLYWSIQPSIEQLNYAMPGETPPSYPWIGKIDLRGKVPVLRRFNDETGEMDEDSNAGAYITDPNDQLFPTFNRAKKRYIHRLLEDVERLIDFTEELFGQSGNFPRKEIREKILAFLKEYSDSKDISPQELLLKAKMMA